MTSKKVLIIAGGTGGHIFPALVIAEALAAQGVSVEWLGAQVGMEKKLVGDRYPLHLLPIKALRGKGLLRKLLAPWRVLRSIYLALKIIKKINPDIVIGMGGYASGPGGIAAWLLRKPLVIHEQNAVSGLTNRILSRLATVVLQAFPDAFSNNKNTKAKTVGNPVRSDLFTLASVEERFARRMLPLKILVLGGSQGAHAINRAIESTLPLLPQEAFITFWHQTGQADLSHMESVYSSYPDQCYRVEAFIEDMAAAYAWADLVICRAGALTVSELMVVGVGSILVPYPYAVDDHQTANAMHLSKINAGLLVPQSQLSPDWLARKLSNFCQSPQQLAIMAKQANSLANKDTVATIVSLVSRY